MATRNRLDYFVIALKGVAMGAADVVPGVSGGTIAFISGIYEELITSINGLNFSLLTTWRREGILAAWKKVNGTFLLALVSGIAISVVSLSRVISWLLENQPVLLWSFFFGLVLASIIVVARTIDRWNLSAMISLFAAAVLAWYITSLPPIENTASLPFLFLSGALAICAMILPGISGAFILVLLGSYKTVLDAVHQKNFLLLGTFILGALFGLLSFSKLLKWMFTHYKNLTLSLLTGFIVGSLNKIWPWKQVLESRMYNEKLITIKEVNVLPYNYEGDSQFLLAILLAVLGFSLIFMLEKLASKR